MRAHSYTSPSASRNTGITCTHPSDSGRTIQWFATQSPTDLLSIGRSTPNPHKSQAASAEQFHYYFTNIVCAGSHRHRERRLGLTDSSFVGASGNCFTYYSTSQTPHVVGVQQDAGTSLRVDRSSQLCRKSVSYVTKVPKIYTYLSIHLIVNFFTLISRPRRNAEHVP